MKKNPANFVKDSSILLAAGIGVGSVLGLYLFLVISKLIMVFGLSGSYFDGLTSVEIMRAFGVSFTYDAYVIACFLLPLIVLLFIPIKGKWFLKTVATFIVFVLCALFFFTVGDILFFSLFFTHLRTEPITALAHIPFILSMSFLTYWYITIPLIGIIGCLMYFLYKLIDKYYQPPLYQWRACSIRLGIILLIGFSIIFGIKGKLSFHGRSLSFMPAQQLLNPKMTDIALNGVFSAWSSLRHYQKRELFFPEEEAVSFVKQRVLLPQDTPLDSQYPLWRTGPKQQRKLNAVIILLESWDKKYLNARPDITPFFHRIKEKSLYYDHFYSSGSRSLLGVTSAFFTIPYVAGLPYLNTGLESYNFSRWAETLRQAGWHTLFLQSDYRLSEKAANWTKYLGFEKFYGKEDIPVLADYPSFNKGFDKDAAAFFFQQLHQIAKPFFAVFYTSSTHSPYTAVLSRQHMPFPNPQNQYEQYYNRLNYADAALEEFFEKAQKEDWFSDTVFFIFPDHRAIFSATPLAETETPYDSFLLVYVPGLLPPGNQDSVVATPEDVLPSVFDLIGAPISFASAGSSLFDSNRTDEKFVYAENGDIYVFSPRGGTSFTLQELKNNPLADWPAQAKNAVLFNEGLYHIIKQNRISPKQ